MDLIEFFDVNPEVALAFSGGVDSAYLLYAAGKYAKRVKAYYVKSEFQPQFELEDAVCLAKKLDAEMEIINISVLEYSDITSNPCNRCYFCKQKIFGEILAAATRDGFKTIIDGTNASDDAADRPGMKALIEMKVLSPLRLCGLTKAQVRELSREAGLFTWDKPAYACLATRIKTGQEITELKLKNTECAEGYLMSLGFKDLRVRMDEHTAIIQIKKEQFPLYYEHEHHIVRGLQEYYDKVIFDKEGR